MVTLRAASNLSSGSFPPIVLHFEASLPAGTFQCPLQ